MNDKHNSHHKFITNNLQRTISYIERLSLLIYEEKVNLATLKRLNEYVDFNFKYNGIGEDKKYYFIRKKIFIEQDIVCF